jgi:hypothetical protein
MKDYHINIFFSDEDGATSPIFRISRPVRPLVILQKKL